MEKKKIILCLGDMGSAEFFTDSVIEGMHAFYDLHILADPAGAGRANLVRRRVPFRDWSGADEDFVGAPVILSGTNGKAQALQRAATRYGREQKVPVVWFGDAEGSGGVAGTRDIAPDVMTHLNLWSEQRVASVRKDPVPPRNIVVGNPSYDELRYFNLETTRYDARKRLGLRCDERFVYYSASSGTRFDIDDTLRQILWWHMQLEVKVRIGAGFHPADPRRNLYDERVRRCTGDAHVLPAGLSHMEIAAASDLLITDFSTTGFKPALVGITTMFIIGDSAQAHLSRNGMEYPYFSVLDSERAPSPALMVTALERVPQAIKMLLEKQECRDHLREAAKQERFASMVDGRGCERTLALIAEVAAHA